MAVILQVRRDYAENWESANPVLAQGEIALEIDRTSPGNGKFKVGDGIHCWSDLQYGGFGGVKGSPGATWYHGSGVPAGNLGVELDYYWNTANGDVYQKGATTWTVVGSIRGPQGIQGPVGATGSSFFSGTGDPDPVLGNVGDTYRDGVNGRFFLKGGSGWNLIGSVPGNIDGGSPDSVYVGIDPIDGGVP